VLVGQPTAGLEEILVKHFHDQTNRITAFPAAPASKLVLLEGQRGGVVVMERAQGLVAFNLET
jgi:hypothetical protein